MLIKIEAIEVNDGRREVNTDKVKELADSIEQIGLINPITVRPDYSGVFKKYVLVAGMHRLEALKLLGRDEILANSISGTFAELELIEIDENLIRNELSYSEIDHLTLRRKEIYEGMYPETKREATLKQNLPKDGIRRTEKPSFVTDTSNKTGKSETIIKDSIYRATNLVPEAKQITESITKTDATDLARQEPEQQRKVIDLIATKQAKTYKEAKEQLDPVDTEYEIKAKEIEAVDKRVKKVLNLLNYTQFRGITEQSVAEYMEMFPQFHSDFINDLEKLKSIADETIDIYQKLNQIRRIK